MTLRVVLRSSEPRATVASARRQVAMPVPAMELRRGVATRERAARPVYRAVAASAAALPGAAVAVALAPALARPAAPPLRVEADRGLGGVRAGSGASLDAAVGSAAPPAPAAERERRNTS